MKKQFLAFPMKCSDCVHFSGIKSLSFKDVCSKLGTKSYANACPSFTPDMSRVARINNSAIAALAKVAASADLSELRLLAASLMAATEIAKHGFTYGQKVWFNLSNPYADYLECYYHGYIVGCTETHMLCASNLETGLHVSLYLPVDSILTYEAFSKKKASLIKRKRLTLPYEKNASRIRTVGVEATQVEEEEYEVPSLDFAPAEFLPDDTTHSEVFEEVDDGVESSTSESGSMTIGFQ